MRSYCNKVWVSNQQVNWVQSIRYVIKFICFSLNSSFCIDLGFRIIKYKMLIDYNRYKIISVKHGG